jgi:hypothetical protein
LFEKGSQDGIGHALEAPVGGGSNQCVEMLLGDPVVGVPDAGVESFLNLALAFDVPAHSNARGPKVDDLSERFEHNHALEWLFAERMRKDNLRSMACCLAADLRLRLNGSRGKPFPRIAESLIMNQNTDARPEAETAPINHFTGPNLEAIEKSLRVKNSAETLYRNLTGIATLSTEALARETYKSLVKLIADLGHALDR